MTDRRTSGRSIVMPARRHHTGRTAAAAAALPRARTGKPRSPARAAMAALHCSVSVAAFTFARALRQFSDRSTRYVFRHITWSRGIAVA